jgi:hypothetical protein
VSAFLLRIASPGEPVQMQTSPASAQERASSNSLKFNKLGAPKET